MFIPGAGFVSAIISIYGTIMAFMERLSKIVAAVTAFIDSIVAIAAGQIAGAAAKVESALAGVLSLAIGLLAGFLGLGGIAAKVMAVVEKVRGIVDKALDTAIAWIVGKAKSLFARLFGGKDKKDERTEEQKKSDLHKGVQEATALLQAPDATAASVAKKLPAIKSKYKMTELSVDAHDSGATKQTLRIHGAINPVEDGPPTEKPKGMEPMTVDFPCKASLLPKLDEYKRQLREAQGALSNMTIETWLKNREAFFQRKAAAKAAGRKNPEGRDPKGTALQAAAREKAVIALVTQLTKANPTLSYDDARKQAMASLADKMATHKLDQVAGGEGTDISDELGDARIDTSIGAAWPSRAKTIQAKVETLPDEAKKEKMKVTLTVNGESL
jgi:hypothetical protein